MVLAVIFIMGTCQNVLAIEPSPIKATVYIDGKQVKLNKSIVEKNGWHFIEAKTFSEAFGFPILSDVMTSEEKRALIGVQQRSIEFLLNEVIEQNAEYRLVLGFSAIIGNLDDINKDATSPDLLFYWSQYVCDFGYEQGKNDGSVSGYFSNELYPSSLTMLADIDDARIKDAKLSDYLYKEIEETDYGKFPQSLIIGDDMYIPFEIACWFLGYTITFDSGDFKIDTSKTHLKLRPVIPQTFDLSALSTIDWSIDGIPLGSTDIDSLQAKETEFEPRGDEGGLYHFAPENAFYAVYFNDSGVIVIDAKKTGIPFWGNYKIGDSASVVLAELFNINIEQIFSTKTRPAGYYSDDEWDFTGYSPDGFARENYLYDEHGWFILYSLHRMFPGNDPNDETYVLRFVNTDNLAIDIYISESTFTINRVYMLYNNRFLPTNNPTELTVQDAEVGVLLTWTGEDDADGYRIYRSEKQGEKGELIYESESKITQFVDVNVKSNTQYYYTIYKLTKNKSDGSITETTIKFDNGTDDNGSAVVTTGEIRGSDREGKKGFLLMKIDSPMMNVNGVEMEIDPGRGTAPLIVNSRTMVPVRAIMEAMGGTVVWDASTDRKSTRLNSSHT